jgi:hypothetical protein
VQDKSYLQEQMSHKLSLQQFDHILAPSIPDGLIKILKLTSESMKICSKPSDNSLIDAVRLHNDTHTILVY